MKKWLNLRSEILPYLSIEVNNTYEFYFGKLMRNFLFGPIILFYVNILVKFINKF